MGCHRRGETGPGWPARPPALLGPAAQARLASCRQICRATTALSNGARTQRHTRCRAKQHGVHGMFTSAL